MKLKKLPENLEEQIPEELRKIRQFVFEEEKRRGEENG